MTNLYTVVQYRLWKILMYVYNVWELQGKNAISRVFYFLFKGNFRIQCVISIDTMIRITVFLFGFDAKRILFYRLRNFRNIAPVFIYTYISQFYINIVLHVTFWHIASLFCIQLPFDTCKPLPNENKINFVSWPISFPPLYAPKCEGVW